MVAKTKKATHTVAHNKLYLRVDGKLQKMKVGTPLTLTKEQAERYGGKVLVVSEFETIDMSGGDVKKPANRKTPDVHETPEVPPVT